MGNIINFVKKHKGVMNQIVEIIDATGAVEGVDFEISSFLVMDDDFGVHSLGGFVGTSSNDLFKSNTGNFIDFIDIANKFTKGKSTQFVSKTEYPKDIHHQKFYCMKEEIDIDLATELGLGVVYMDNEYMLYSPFMKDDATWIVYEMMMLKVYAQLRDEKTIDLNLKSGFEKNEDIIAVHMVGNGYKHIMKLREIYGLRSK